MKRLLIVIALLLVWACGREDGENIDEFQDCLDGCTSEIVETSDQDGNPTFVYIPGPAGQPGAKGDAGQNGIDGQQGPQGESGPQGVAGSKGEKGDQGEIGPQGIAGQDGQDGRSMVFNITDATSCPAGGKTILIAVDTNDNGVLDVLEDSDLSSATICNGVNGENGEDAPPTPFTPIDTIDPCGDSPSVLDEVLLRLYDGSVLASVSDSYKGNNTRFVILAPGTYTTTDGEECIFTLDSFGDIINESHQN